MIKDILDRIQAIHDKKSSDYAAAGKRHENFERSATLIGWFKSDADKAFVAMIATKLARLATLLNSEKLPSNESIDDSFLDLATYCVLWMDNYQDRIDDQMAERINKQLDQPQPGTMIMASYTQLGTITKCVHDWIKRLDQTYYCTKCRAETI